MADAFEMSFGDMIKLQKMFNRAPKKMQRVVSGVLNSQAFGLRSRILKVIDNEMTIRAPGFVKGRVRVVKSSPGPVNSAASEVGSIFADRFTGWKEQQFGTESKRKRVHTKFSRAGRWRGKVRQELRSRQKNPIWRMSDFNITNAKNKKHRLIIFLQMLDQKKIKDRFSFPGSLGRMNPVVYAMKGGKIRGIHNPSHRVRDTKRIRWMDKSIDLLNKELNIQQLWEKNIKFVFRLR